MTIPLNSSRAGPLAGSSGRGQRVVAYSQTLLADLDSTQAQAVPRVHPPPDEIAVAAAAFIDVGRIVIVRIIAAVIIEAEAYSGKSMMEAIPMEAAEMRSAAEMHAAASHMHPAAHAATGMHAPAARRSGVRRNHGHRGRRQQSDHRFAQHH